jgi:V/A-type H+/Na+-transporting ATPase subunit K
MLLFSALGIGFVMLCALSPTASGQSLAMTNQSVTSATTVTVTQSATSAVSANPEKVLAAGIGFGLAALGAGIAVGLAGSAAIAAITEKPNLFGRVLIIVVLGEGIAIYGFLIVFILSSL